MINVFQPSLGAEELAAVAEVFDSSWVGKGPKVAEFEAAFAARLGVAGTRLLSVDTCTEATFLAVRLAGLGAGCDVVMPTIAFVSAANAVAAHGARPVFCDVDPHTLNPTAEHVEAALTPATKAVLVLHYGGHPGEIDRIADLCAERRVVLIEDAANAVASAIGERACGTFGDFGVWSFDHGKIAVAGDGGMLYARDPDLVERARKLAYLGLEQASGFAQAAGQTATRWWDITVSSFSRRSVMNDILAAIGCVQLRRLDGFLRRRAEIVAHYDRALAGIPALGLPPALPPGHRGSHYFYWVQMPAGIRDEVARDLYDRGIYTTMRYPLLHRVRAYGSDARLPGAESAAARTLNLPLHQGLSDGDVEAVVAGVRAAVTARVPALPVEVP
ncbi:DegT/DnrJ/EryC1/StrS family aminotransferase [Amycolatopsis oliviviridis]|uniref:Aminotransferase DegT n=1 Tax=Amycolatopsis oliviviridis TaxID=1471590 RepID=A0ABQ3L433_9PSEU|nr:aminotransferase class I/II-fold pyridoxal phosphate-dependent enzyme [Amycolatopsis oliviviridis]GHH01278.1 aminotransferase DegT [Amycolatopsis oliviviridis]